MKIFLTAITSLATLAHAINDCADSTFINQSSGASPSIADCQQIARNIAGDGSWQIQCAGNGQRTFVTYGTCAMGAHCIDGGVNIARIGNEDAIDIINESIKRFSYDGKVGAKGRMACQDDFSNYPGVEWGIYHT